MKAIYIPYNFDPDKDLDKLNRELKDAYSIKFHTDINIVTGEPSGVLLITRSETRKDKLDKINKIANEGIDNHSL